VCADADVICDGDHTLVGPDGSPVDCTPYKCSDAGTCLNLCSSQADCVAGYFCNSSDQCVPDEAGAQEGDGGCGCRVAPRRGDGWPWLGLAALAIGVVRRRRRRLAA
jgi:MYXO-CTERM domain-containing protein